ncbi:MAG TPA: aldo/keto reductase [Chthonomonadaceae bacterium]|nr:aldo/keto reductase [Chthonomonadaceae bacterium]
MQDEQLIHLKQQSQEKPLSRRDFMRALTVASAAGPGLVAVGLTGFSLTRSQRAEAAEAIVGGLGKLPKVQLGTKMGKMMVTPLCIASDWNGDLYAPAVAMGINFIHKAGYWGNVPEEIKKLPRESYYTDITVDNTPSRPDDEEGAYNQVTSSLQKNGLKYYDIFRAHFGWRGIEAFNKGDNASYRAFLRLKKEGKVKYFGVSQHPYARTVKADGQIDYPERIEKYTEMIQAEIDSGLIDSMQVWYSYGYPKEAEEVFAKASKAGIGMTAMKIFAHGSGKMRNDAAKMTELKADGMVGRAVIRYAMTVKRPDGKPIFHTCVSALGNQGVFEENVSGVSTKVALRDGFDPYAA